MRETEEVGAPEPWESYNQEVLNVKSLNGTTQNVRMTGGEAWECSNLQIKGPQGI